MWGVGASTLQYWNGSAWIPATGTNQASANALGGTGVDGALYFSDQVLSTSAPKMYRAAFNNAGGTITVSASLGAIATPTTGSFLSYTNTSSVSKLWTPTAYNLVGATFDRSLGSKKMFIYATGTGATEIPTTTGPVAVLGMIGLLDPEAPGTVSWQAVYETTGPGSITYPQLNTSGDLFADQQSGGQLWIISNTNPNRVYKVSINYTNYTLLSAQVVGTATIQFPAGTDLTGAQQGIAVDPQSGLVYTSTGPAATTYKIIDQTAKPVVASASFASGVADAGNCVDKPDPPTITKSFNPTSDTTGIPTVRTTTMTITITNPNYVPLFLSNALTDSFSNKLTVTAGSIPVVSCFSNSVASTKPTSTTMSVTTSSVGATMTVTVAAGSMIPGGLPGGGSCTFAVALVSGSSQFTINTIPAGGLTTTAGVNANAAVATYTRATTDFSVTKYQQKGASGATTTAAISVPVSSTILYTLRFTNDPSSSGNRSITFTDSIPQGMTNTSGLAAFSSSITTASYAITGGATIGSCQFAVASLGAGGVGLLVTGTITTATPGAGCEIVIPLRVTNTAVATGITNTVTITTLGGFTDANLANNTAVVVHTTIANSANLTIIKSNQVTTLTPSGTTSYTLTVANLGPNAAANTLLQDTPGTGLLCSSVSCTSAIGVGAACPAAGSVTMSNLAGSGIPLQTFGANQTLTFSVTCSVSATGQ